MACMPCSVNKDKEEIHFKVVVRDLKRQVDWITCSESDYVIHLKHRIKEETGIPVEIQRLHYNGKLMDDEKFLQALGEASEFTLGPAVQCSQRFSFPLRQRHAIDYVCEGAALVGDAAHTIHPLAGQGVNLGLADIEVLAEEVLAAWQRGTDPGSLPVLKRYQRQRKGDNLAMMAAMDGFKRLFEQQAPPIRWLRNAGMRGVGSLAPLKRRIIRQAMGVA